ncbi:hypothetical protein WBG78_07120 [Chryseolinea sp. T2]|uniref:hypothetical protein n=1 Tax=Chryseolinea sp. T2 TaxID=3129255 RepID=UPI0030768923
MRNSYLEYYQLILQKVSFDRRLFTKEYFKAIKWLNQNQRIKLDQWIGSMGLGHLMTASDETDEGNKITKADGDRSSGYNKSAA